jgi:hypothetical protein
VSRTFRPVEQLPAVRTYVSLVQRVVATGLSDRHRPRYWQYKLCRPHVTDLIHWYDKHENQHLQYEWAEFHSSDEFCQACYSLEREPDREPLALNQVALEVIV